MTGVFFIEVDSKNFHSVLSISYHPVDTTNGDAIYAEQWVGSVSDV